MALSMKKKKKNMMMMIMKNVKKKSLSLQIRDRNPLKVENPA
jgi:hypothetical protein